MNFFNKKKHSTHPKHQSIRLWKNHRRGWVAVLVLLMASSSLVENGQYLQLSFLTTPEHAAFDGTVYPIDGLPSYDPSRLLTDFDELNLSNSYDALTYEMKTTYTTVYAGTYQLDYVEGAGSHPAVDIIADKGTPIQAIAN
ncbi:MAG: hypothetical protein Q8P27_00345, partial [Candidatus Peregrinibacteria bacterium]|nr:hypothetical protein [Candidatus Peregrinibacteria bacterium]